MKFLFLFLFVYFEFGHCKNALSEKVVFQKNVKWGASKEKYKIQATIPSEWDDPGDFTTLRVFKNKKIVFELKNIQAVKFNYHPAFQKNAIDFGHYFKMIEISKSINVICFNIWLGGSSLDQLNFLALDSNGIPTVIFQSSYNVSEVIDYDQDGLKDILVKGGSGEPFSNEVFSYDPYLILKQKNSRGVITFSIDEEMSKKWSKDNHYEWHGKNYDEKIKVNKDGKLISLN
jgi:hypothetical protein